MRRLNENNFGFSLVEIILAIALFGLFATALIGLLFSSYGSDEHSIDRQKATLYASEGLDAAQSIRRQAWNLLTIGTHGLDSGSGYWELSGSSDEPETGFTRTLEILQGCRNGSDDIIDCDQPGAITDVHLKKIISNVSYTDIVLIPQEVELVGYVTTWTDTIWTQTDWSGGDGQTIWSASDAYDSDDGNVTVSAAGQVTLASTGGAACGTYVWPFTTPANYTYNSSDIEVTGGVAQLVSNAACSGTPDACTTFVSEGTCTAQSGCNWSGSPASGANTNTGFTTDATGWTYTDWSEQGNNVNGSYVASGGNPGGYVNVAVSKQKNATLSGYWQQPFTTTVNNPTTATIDMDWIVSQYSASFVTSFQVYLFVDSAAGAPTLGQQVWSSGEITNTTSWAGISTVDISSQLATAGTYYIKAAVQVVTTGGGGGASGTNTVGFDNIAVYWEGTSGGSCSGTPDACTTFNDSPSCSAQSGCSWSGGYPTDEPNIYPTSSYDAGSVDTWSSFTETATKNGGEIYYQLSDDGGSTWQYWNGASWATAGATNYNIATTINSNISSFSTSTAEILFQAFLESDGTQQVQLDNIRIGWSEAAGGGSGYATSGWLLSSAFDMSNDASVHVVEWDETIPACSPECSVQLQVRTAPDSGGSPGAWTSWYGATGASSYFTNATGTIVSTDLNFNQWVQYRVELSGDGLDTPVLQETRLYYLP